MLFMKHLLLVKEKYKDFNFLEIYYDKCIFNSNVRIEQLVAHWAHAPKVVSSSLASNIKTLKMI